MKSWGRYELVASPAEADLVFEIRFTAPIADLGKTAIYEPQLGLSIVDTKTRFVLWTFTEPVQAAFRKLTWEKNVHQGIENLLADIKKLAGTPLSASVDGPNQNLRSKLLSALPPLPLRCHRRDTVPRCHGVHYGGSFRRLA